MRKIMTAIALTTLISVPAVAQNAPNANSPSASPGTSVNEQTLPKNQLPSANTDESAKQSPPASNSGTRALRPGQNPDSTPRDQSPGSAPQLPGNKGQGN